MRLALGLSSRALLPPLRGKGGPWNPAWLFARGEAGVLLEAGDPALLAAEPGGGGLVSPGERVAYVLDRSGNGNSLTQPDPARRPVLARDQGGQLGLAFHRSFLVGRAGLAAAGSASVFLVGRADRARAGTELLSEGSLHSSAPRYLLLGHHGRVLLRDDGDRTVLQRDLPGLIDDTTAVVGVVDHGDRLQAWRDGRPLGPPLAYRRQGRFSPTYLALGGRPHRVGAALWSGTVHAMLAIGRALEPDEIAQLTPWLGARAGLSL